MRRALSFVKIGDIAYRSIAVCRCTSFGLVLVFPPFESKPFAENQQSGFKLFSTSNRAMFRAAGAYGKFGNVWRTRIYLSLGEPHNMVLVSPAPSLLRISDELRAILHDHFDEEFDRCFPGKYQQAIP